MLFGLSQSSSGFLIDFGAFSEIKGQDRTRSGKNRENGTIRERKEVEDGMERCGTVDFPLFGGCLQGTHGYDEIFGAAAASA
jgi:hypothetical protein